MSLRLNADLKPDLKMDLNMDLVSSLMATRAASSTSTLQHSHITAVRRCAAVLTEIPKPPPIASHAAMHIGHFGTSASATLGSANAAALRVRRLGRFSPAAVGPAAA
jgi:hypothetical protein